MNDYIWPDIFHHPNMPFHPDEDALVRKGAAISDALCGWSICMAGSKPPQGFGMAMAKLSQIADCSGTPEAFSAAADQWEKERDAAKVGV